MPHLKAGNNAGEPAWLRTTFPLFLLGFVALVLLLPVFPSNDGPMHIYYSAILWRLATGAPTAYSHFFAIRHLLQPYSLHYYALIALMQVVSQAWAEKLVVAAVLLTVALGFRSLARRLGPGWQLASLLQFPLLLSWPLGDGFMNFCFSVGVSLFAFGLWFALEAGHSRARLFPGYLLALAVLVISHPVPLLVLVLLTGGDMGLQLLASWRARGRFRPSISPWHAAMFAASCLALLAPALLADRSTAGASGHDIFPHPELMRELGAGTRVSLWGGHAPLALLHQVLVVALLPAVVALQWGGLRQRWQARTLGASDRLCVLAVGYTLLLVTFPLTVNGSAHFAERMWLITWLLALASLAGAGLPSSRVRVLGWAGVAWAALALLLAAQTLLPVARRQAQLARAPLPEGQRGLFLEPPSAVNGALIGANATLYFWGGGRPFAQHGDVMLNSPWMHLTIMPLRERPGAPLIDNTLPSVRGNAPADQPVDLFRDMLASAHAREAALREADFVLYADPVDATPHPVADAERTLGEQLAAWQCQGYGFYAICTRRSTR